MRAFLRQIRIFSLQTVMFAALLAAPAHAQDITTGLVGHWYLDETAGTTATDSSGSGNDGTMTGGLSGANDSINGKVGTALDFDGNDYIDMGNIGIVTNQPASSICMWFNYRGANPLTEREMLIAEWQSGFHGWFLMLDDGAQTIAFSPSTLFGNTINTGASTIVANEWTHVCATFLGSTFTRLYVNGTMITEDTTAIPAVMHNGSLPLRIASQQFGNQFNGFIDDVRIYNRALTDEDVFALAKTYYGPMTCNAAYEAVMIFNHVENVLQYCNGTDWVAMGRGTPGAPTTGLIHHWSLDQPATGPLIDAAGASNCTVSGSVVSVDGPDGHAVDLSGGGGTGKGNCGDLNASLAGQSAVTYSAWMKRSQTNEDHLSVGVSSSGAGAGVASINIDYWDDGSAYCQLNDTAGGNTYDEGGYPSNDANWHHITCVFDGSETGTDRLKMYYDGRPVTLTYAGGTSFPTTIPNQVLNWRIGPYGNAGTADDANGSIDDVRIYNRILSENEIAELYLATGGSGLKVSTGAGTCTSPDGVGGEVGYNFTQGVMQYCNGTAWVNMGPQIGGAGTADITYTEPTSNLVGHWTLDETSGSSIADSSGNGNTGTWSDNADNDVTGETISGQNGTALSFDGTDDFINVADQPELSGGTGLDRSWSFWIYPNAVPTGEQNVLTKALNSSFKDWEFAYKSDQRVRFYYENGSGNDGPCECYLTSTFNTGEWNHVAATYDGSTRELNLYANGLLESTFTLAFDLPDTTGPLQIAQRSYTPGTDNFDGQVDDVRVYDSLLTSEEIYALYRATGGTNSGLAGHWTLDETAGTTAADSSGNTNDAALSGGMDASTTSTAGISGSALAFDGAAHYANLGDVLDMGTSDFSVSFWFSADAAGLGNYQALVAKRAGDAGVPGWFIRLNNSDQIQIRAGDGTADQLLYGPTITGDTWYHAVAVIRPSDNTTQLYVNGLFSTEVTAGSIGNVDNSENLQFGDWTNGGNRDYFDGSLDDVRIFNRALSAAEVSSLYSGTSGNPPPADCTGLGDASYNDSASGHCYFRIDTAADWATAQGNCATDDGYLTSITTQAEQDLLNSMWVQPAAANFWIGATDSAVEGEWRWTGGEAAGVQFWAGDETGSPVNGLYNAWWPSGGNPQPDDAGGIEDCGEMRDNGPSFNGLWNDDPCGSTKPYICEKSSSTGDTCINPRGTVGEMIYNDDNNVMQYCVGAGVAAPNGWIETR